MSKRMRRRYRRNSGSGWIYIFGAVIAVLAVLAVIAIGALSRNGEDAPSGPPIVPTARPAAVPAEGLVYGDPNAPVTIIEYLDFQ